MVETPATDEFQSQPAAMGSSPVDAPHHVYRSVSRGAVASMILAVCSTMAWLWPAMVILPLIGSLVGLLAWMRIRRYPDEYTGQGLAVTGWLLCFAIFVAAVSRHSYVYATEVPEGYQRISFHELQPKVVNGPPPTEAVDLQDQMIFVKGYMHPGVQDRGKVRSFVLVPDMKTCCFGGQPKMSDMIDVQIVEGEGTAYSMKKLKLTGRFRLRQPRKAGKITTGYYALDADSIQ